MGNTGATRVVKPPTTIDVMVMRIVTRFTTVDEFVSAFRAFCGEETCFIPSAQAKRVGIETGFSIRLADGTPMLRGLCVVLDSWATADNPYARPGVRLGIRSLTAESKPVFQRLLLAGAAAKPELDLHAKATVEMPPLFTAEQRAPHAELILPANPLTEMSDESLQAFVDCMIFEDAIPEPIDVRDAGRAASLERALAAAASSTVRLDGGTQRIERLESPLVRARELADQHADSAFGDVLAQAAERLVPVADHTVPTAMPPEMLEAAAANEDEAVTPEPVAAASSKPRSTILGFAPVPHPTPRARISMAAITDPAAPPPPAMPFPSPPATEPSASTTAMIHRPTAPGWWRRVTTRIRGWYKRLLWARRRRAALRR
jgi:hypothetical protein